MFSALRRTSQAPSLKPPLYTKARCYADKADAVKADEKPSTEAEKKDEKKELPMLTRPLGVTQRPTSFVKKWGETQMEILMDRDRKLEQRRHLIRQIGKGYYEDMINTRHFGGKTWLAPKTVIREDKALYFPDIVGTPLDKDRDTKVHTTDMLRGKISVVGMLGTQISDEHVRYFVLPTNEAFFNNPKYPEYQHVLINLQENILKSMLVNMFVSSIRRSIPKELHSTYMLSNQDLEYVREPMGLDNKHVGYVYLVDENLKIRWAGCGDAKVEESDALLRCTKVLLERLQKKKAESAKEGKDQKPPDEGQKSPKSP